MFCLVYLHVVLDCDNSPLIEYVLPQAVMAEHSLVLIGKEIPELV